MKHATWCAALSARRLSYNYQQCQFIYSYGIVARTMSEKTRDQIAAEVAARCAALGTPTPSALPADPALPPDAQQLRAEGTTPLEYAMSIVNDDSIDTRTRLDAAKAAMSYMHRQPAAKTEMTVSSDEMGRALFAAALEALRSGQATPDEVRAIAAQARGMSH